MTAIVGVVNDGDVWLGGDACGASPNWRAALKTPKLVELHTGSGTLVLGYTTSFRFGQILQYRTEPPYDVRKDAEEYLVKEFVPTVRNALQSEGWLKKENDREESGSALVGYRSRLFEFSSDLSFIETEVGLSAVGSGCEYALGAMLCASNQQWAAIAILEAGLQAAAAFTPGVMAPFFIRKVGFDVVRVVDSTGQVHAEIRGQANPPRVAWKRSR